MSSTAAEPPPRGPLVDLPLSLYLPPIPPINGNRNYDSLPSPVSLPLKRGPPTPLREGSSLHSTTTPKRRISRDMLDADDLGTGKSPARLLFTPPSSASPRAAKPSSSKTPTALVPSPPMPSRRSARLAAAAAAKSKSKGARTVSVFKDPIHAPGFVIFADTRPVRPSFTTTTDALVLVPFIHDDEENTPPPPSAEVARTPMTSRRNRTMERSKLGTQSVTAAPPPPPTKAAVIVVSEAAAVPATSGKEGMKLEADAAV